MLRHVRLVWRIQKLRRSLQDAARGPTVSDLLSAIPPVAMMPHLIVKGAMMSEVEGCREAGFDFSSDVLETNGPLNFDPSRC